MRLRRALTTAAALALGVSGLLAVPASAVPLGPGGPADCDAYVHNDVNGTGYAAVTCYAPSAFYVGHVVCQPRGTMWPTPTYTVTGTATPKNVTATIRCHQYDTAVSADGVQA
jgi:hypothetical protein